MKSQNSGFTLIELLIVVAVVAILTTLAHPSYQDAIRKSNRGAAESLLTDVAQRQQQFLLDNRGYAGPSNCTDQPAFVATLNVNPGSVSDVCSHYDVTVTPNAGPPPSFIATATPKGRQQADLGGQALTIDNRGAKAPSGAW